MVTFSSFRIMLFKVWWGDLRKAVTAYSTQGDFGLYNWVLRGGAFTQNFSPSVWELHLLSHSHWVNVLAMPGVGGSNLTLKKKVKRHTQSTQLIHFIYLSEFLLIIKSATPCTCIVSPIVVPNFTAQTMWILCRQNFFFKGCIWTIICLVAL